MAGLPTGTEHNRDDSTTPEHSTYDGGHKIAHQALLETLNGIRERQAKVGKRVRDDFEEMAKILETIWMGTFDVRTTFQGGRKEASSAATPTTSGTREASTAEKQSASAATAAATVAVLPVVEKSSSSAENGLVTASDNNGKVLKKMRKVSFDDEVGTSEQEKDLLRRMEEKIAGMERKLTKLVLVEKENVKVSFTML
jgi:isopentenyl diphosphate isomerase/L-lactate dehydrogenase-like FMN-dependent dehydrogenase